MTPAKRSRWHEFVDQAIRSSVSLESLETRLMMSANAVGYLDNFIPSTGQISGWVADPDVPTQSLQMVVTVDPGTPSAKVFRGITANASRTDVRANYTWIQSDNVGFNFVLPLNAMSAGTHSLQVAAVDANTGEAGAIGSVQTFNVAAVPAGNSLPIGYVEGYDSASRTFRGWAADLNSGASAVSLVADVDNGAMEILGTTTNGSRSDVHTPYPQVPVTNQAGFSFSYSLAGLSAGTHQITLRAVDANGSGSIILGSTSVSATQSLTVQSPTGAFTADSKAMRVVAWGWDPTDTTLPVYFAVTVNNQTPLIINSDTVLANNGRLLNVTLPASNFQIGNNTIKVETISRLTGLRYVIGTQTLTVQSPIGSLDTTTSGGMRISGWGNDATDPSQAVQIAVTINNQAPLMVPAMPQGSRLDVAPSAVGFDTTLNYALFPIGYNTIKVEAVSTATGLRTTLGTQVFNNLAPFGQLDASPPGTTTLTGWAVDPELGSNAALVDVYIDDVPRGRISASQYRSDLATNAAISGLSHGFRYTLPGDLATDKPHKVQFYALDGDGTRSDSGNALITQRTIATGPMSPVGQLESGSSRQVTGWAYDPNDANQAVSLFILVDDINVTAKQSSSVANLARADLAGQSLRTACGFNFTLAGSYAPGIHTVKVYARDLNGQSADVLLGTQTFTSTLPVGNVDGVTATGHVLGWAYDPDLGDNPVSVSIYNGANLVGTADANISRDDLNGRYGSNNHGFDFVIPMVSFPVSTTPYTFTVQAKDDRDNTGVAALGTGSLTQAPPRGNLDTLGVTGPGVAGWAFDPNAGSDSISVDFYLDGTASANYVGTTNANQTRSDLQSVLGSAAHGFSYTVNTTGLSAGLHKVNAYAIDTSKNSNSNVLLGTQNIQVGTPYGNLDSAGLNYTTVSGWVFDTSRSGGTGPVPIKIVGDCGGVALTLANNIMLAGQSRPDLASYLGSTAHGFSWAIPNLTTVGTYTFKVYAQKSSDAAGQYTQLLGTQTLTVGAPIGALDTLNLKDPTISGWAFDYRYASNALTIQTQISDSAGVVQQTQQTTANISRGDLTGPLGSANHGFSQKIDLSKLPAGTYTATVMVVDPGNSAKTITIGTQTFTTGVPYGDIDSAGDGLPVLAGWAVDPKDTTQPIRVDVYYYPVGQPGLKTFLTSTQANIARPDLASKGVASYNHGFYIPLDALPPGVFTVEAYGWNLNTGSASVNTVNPLLKTKNNVIRTERLVSLGQSGLTSPVANWTPVDAVTNVAVGDFDGDGRDDILAQRIADKMWRLYHVNISTNTVDSGSDYFPGTFLASSITVGDYNGDGRADAMAWDPVSGRSIFLQGGSGVETLPTTDSQKITATSGVTADIQGSGKAVMQSFILSQTLAGSLVKNLASGDFNADGRQDLVALLSSDGGVSWKYDLQYSDGNSEQEFQGPQIIPGDSNGTMLAGDFDGDGKSDLAFQSQSNPAMWRILSNLDSGSPTLQTRTISATLSNPVAVDLDQDGVTDIVGYGNGRLMLARSAPVAGSSVPTTFSLVDISGTAAVAPGMPIFIGNFYQPIQTSAAMLTDFYNNYAYVPYAGSQRSVGMVQAGKAGNAWDLSNALMTGLINVGIQAQLATGRVRLSMSDAKSWLGLASDAPDSSVTDLLTLAATNPALVTDTDYQAQLGNGSAVEFNHVWVQAYLPGSGGMSWRNLDPSIKFHDEHSGVNTLSLFTGDAFSKGGYYQNSPVANETPQEFFERKLMEQATASGNYQSLADMSWSSPIIGKNFTSVPSGTPWKLAPGASLQTYPQIPTTMQQTISIQVDGTAGPTMAKYVLQGTSFPGELSINWSGTTGHTPNLIGRALSTNGVLGGTAVSDPGETTLTPGCRDGGASETQTLTITINSVDGSGKPVTRVEKFILVPGKTVGIGIQFGNLTDEQVAREAEELDREAAGLTAKNTAGTLGISDANDFTRRLAAYGAMRYVTQAQESMTALGNLTGFVLGLNQPRVAIVIADAITSTDTLNSAKAFGQTRFPISVGMTLDAGLNPLHLVAMSSSTSASLSGAQDLLSRQSSAFESDTLAEITSHPAISTAVGIQYALNDSLPIVSFAAGTNQATIDSSIRSSQANLAARYQLSNSEVIALATAVAADTNAGYQVALTTEKISTQYASSPQWYGSVWIAQQANASGEWIQRMRLLSTAPNSIVRGGGVSFGAYPPTLPTPGLSAMPYTDTVDPVSGQLHWTENDFNLPNPGVAFDFSRTYNSNLAAPAASGALVGSTLSSLDLGMGAGWTYTWCDTIVEVGDGLSSTSKAIPGSHFVWITSSGQQNRFDLDYQANGSLAFRNQAGVFGTLAFANTGGLNSNAPQFTNTLNYTDTDGTVWTFTQYANDVVGTSATTYQRPLYMWRISKIVDPDGNGVQINRTTSGVLTSVQGLVKNNPQSASRTLAFTTSSNTNGWHIASIAAPGSVAAHCTWQYTYSTAAITSSTALVSAAGANDPTLSSTSNFSHAYSYDSVTPSTGLLTSIQESTPGNPTPTIAGELARFSWDSLRQVTRVIKGDGFTREYVYNPVTRHVAQIDTTGQSDYLYDSSGHITRTIAPDRSTQSTTWGRDTLIVSNTTTTFADKNTDGSIGGDESVKSPVINPLSSNQTLVYGDWNGDSILEAGEFGSSTVSSTQANYWQIDGNSDGKVENTGYFSSTSAAIAGGIASPVVGDWDGRGFDVRGVISGTNLALDPTELSSASATGNISNWLLLAPPTGLASGARAFVGDFNGDGTADIGFESGGTFWIHDKFVIENGMTAGTANSLAYVSFPFTPDDMATSNPSAFAFSGDFNGDGKDEIGLVYVNTAGRIEAAIDSDGSQSFTPADKKIMLGFAAQGTALTTLNAQGLDWWGTKSLPATSTDATGRKTQYFYDTSGRLSSTIAPDQRLTTQTYGVYSVPVTTTLKAGGLTQTTVNSYDANTSWHLSFTQDPDGNITNDSINAQGQVTSITGATLADGSRPTISIQQYHPSGLPTQVTDAMGGVSQWTIDDAGRILSYQSPTGSTVNYAVNAAGQILSATTTPTGSGQVLSKLSYNYLPDGLLASSIDANGKLTNYTCDQAHRLVRTTYPDGTFVQNTYDAQGNLITRRDADGAVTLLRYDANKRLIETLKPDGSWTFYRYDGAGRIIAQETGQNSASDAARPQAAITRTTYDIHNNPLKITDPLDIATSYTYDALGRQVSQTGPVNNSTQFGQIDSASNVTQTNSAITAGGLVTQELNGNQSQITITYDGMGHIKTQTISDLLSNSPARTASYHYNALGQMVWQQDALNNISTWQYNTADELVASVDALGQRTDYTYDAMGRKIAQDDPALESLTIPAGVTPVKVSGVGSVTQTLTLPSAGSWRVALQAAQVNTSVPQCLTISIGGKSQVITPVGSSFKLYQTDAFDLASAATSITITGSGGDSAIFYGLQVLPVQASLLLDGGFEGSSLAAGSFAYQPVDTSWGFGTNTGIDRGSVAWGSVTATDGNAQAFIQGAGQMCQALGDVPTGTYTLSLNARQRPGNVANQAFTVAIYASNNQAIASWTCTPGNAWTSVGGDFAVGASGPLSIRLTGAVTSQDISVLLDSINLVRKDTAVNVAIASNNPVPDASFEAWAGDYVYAPTNQGWTFNSAGVAKATATTWLGSLKASNGANVAFLQGQGTVTQAVNISAAGNYVLSYALAQRQNAAQTANESVNLYIDGKLFDTSTPTSSWSNRAVSLSALTAGYHTFTWQGTQTSDSSALLDNIVLARADGQTYANPFANNSFENWDTSSYVYSSGGVYAYAPSGLSWSFGPGTGLARGNTSFTSQTPTSDGSNVAFIQGSGQISQTLTNLTPGSTYALQLRAMQRPTNNGGNQILQLYVGSNLIGSMTPATGQWGVWVFPTFTVSGSSAQISIRGTVTTVDATALVDSINIMGPGASVTASVNLLDTFDQQALGSFLRPRTTWTYNADSTVASQKDPNGNVTTFTYDWAGRKTTQTLVQAGGGASWVTKWFYDAKGNLVTTIDPQGIITTHRYDAAGHVIATIVAGPDWAHPSVTSYRYDAVGRLVDTINPLGVTTTQLYNLDNQVIGVISAARRIDTATNQVRMTYDAITGQVNVYLPGHGFNTGDHIGINGAYQSGFNGTFNLTVVDADHFRYTPLTAPSSAIASGKLLIGYQSSATGYWQNGSVQWQEDANGNRTWYVVNGLGQQLAVYQPQADGSRPTLADYKTYAATSAQAPSKINAYNGFGELTSQNTLVSYSASGADPKVKTPVFVTTTQGYDLRGQVISTQQSDPSGSGAMPTLVTNTYDALGRQTSQTDILNRQTRWTYDSAGHKIVTTQVDPDGSGIQQASISYAAYDGDGNQVATADSFGHTTWNIVDGLNRTIRTTEWRGVIGEDRFTNYNDTLRSVTQTIADPANPGTKIQVSRTIRDNAGRVISVTIGADDPATNAARTVTYAYDRAGELVSTANPASGTTLFAYDALGREIEQEESGSGSGYVPRRTFYKYDSAGHLVEQDNPSNPDITIFGPMEWSPSHNVIWYSYDALGEKTAERTPTAPVLGPGITQNFSTSTWVYNVDGTLKSVTDPNGNTTSYQYDLWGRETVSQDATLAQSGTGYDAAGRVIRSISKNGQIIDSLYDQDDKLVRELWRNGAGNITRVIDYRYDQQGRLTSIVDPDSTELFRYDDAGRVVSHTQITNGVTINETTGYDLLDRVVSQTQTVNGQFQGTQTFTYNANGDVSVSTITTDGVTKRNISYAYQNNGLLNSETLKFEKSNASTIAMTYTNAGELATLVATMDGNRPVISESYTYGNDGNILTWNDSGTTKNYQYDAQGQVISDGSAISYDANGDRLTNTATYAFNRLTSDAQFQYSYDAEGNLIAKMNRDGTGRTDFTWDNRNRLIQVVIKDRNGNATSTVTYAYNAENQRIKRVETGTNNSTELYFYSGTQLILVTDASGNVQEHNWYDRNGHQIAQNSTTGWSWVYTDHLGSVRAMTDINNNGVTQAISYDTFGKATSGTVSHVGYTGYDLDSTTGLYYAQARWYDANAGRFIGNDPLGFGAGDMNLQRYVGNNPLNKIDPSGKDEYGYDDGQDDGEGGSSSSDSAEIEREREQEEADRERADEEASYEREQAELEREHEELRQQEEERQQQQEADFQRQQDEFNAQIQEIERQNQEIQRQNEQQIQNQTQRNNSSTTQPVTNVPTPPPPVTNPVIDTPVNNGVVTVLDSGSSDSSYPGYHVQYDQQYDQQGDQQGDQHRSVSSLLLSPVQISDLLSLSNDRPVWKLAPDITNLLNPDVPVYTVTIGSKTHYVFDGGDSYFQPLYNLNSLNSSNPYGSFDRAMMYKIFFPDFSSAISASMARTSVNVDSGTQIELSEYLNQASNDATLFGSFPNGGKTTLGRVSTATNFVKHMDNFGKIADASLILAKAYEAAPGDRINQINWALADVGFSRAVQYYSTGALLPEIGPAAVPVGAILSIVVPGPSTWRAHLKQAAPYIYAQQTRHLLD